MEKSSYDVLIAFENMDKKMRILDSEWKDKVKEYFFIEYDTSLFKSSTNNLVEALEEYSDKLKDALNEIKYL